MLINTVLLMSFFPLFYVDSVFCISVVDFCLLLISIKSSILKKVAVVIYINETGANMAILLHNYM